MVADEARKRSKVSSRSCAGKAVRPTHLGDARWSLLEQWRCRGVDASGKSWQCPLVFALGPDPFRQRGPRNGRVNRVPVGKVPKLDHCER